MAKKQKSNSITFQFDNHEAQHYFWAWLCNQGEQSYWESQSECEKDDESENITALSFDYKNADYGLVVTKCGRFTGDKFVMENEND